MALEDKLRWNEKHAKDEMPHTPIELVTRYASLAPGKRALDIACGNGRHTLWLRDQGFAVDALDISDVAIERLQGIRGVHAQTVDLDTYNLPKKRYDLIVKVYYLNRRLFPQIIDALKPGGIVIMETFVHHPDNERAPSNPAFRLEQGEPEAAFDERCELLHIREYWDTDYRGFKTLKAAMVARKRHGGMSDEAFWSS